MPAPRWLRPTLCLLLIPLTLTAPSLAQGPALPLQMPAPYTPDGALRDDYRCFLIDPQLESEATVKGYRIRPQAEGIVHHVILFVISGNTIEAARAVDAAAPGPGWTCFGGPGVVAAEGFEAFQELARGFVRSLGVWTPGVETATFPAGTGKPLAAGSQIVMQVHYNLQAGAPAPDQSAVELFLAEPDEALERLRLRALVAPVELRCPGPYPKDEKSPCHRDFAMSQLELPVLADAVHLECGSRPSDFIERDVGFGDNQSFSCTTFMTSDGEALGVLTHMHLRGRTITVELNPNTPRYTVLHHNPAWNFNAQEDTWFPEPVPFRFGDIVRLTCSYDNSGAVRGPDGQPLEPRYVTWGEGTTDEMCLAGIHHVRR